MQFDQVISKGKDAVRIGVIICEASLGVLEATRKAGEAMIAFSDAGISALNAIQEMLRTVQGEVCAEG